MSSYGEIVGAAAEPVDTDDGSSLSSLESLSPLFDDGRNGFMPHLEPSVENPDPVSEMLYADSNAIGAGAVEMGWVEANSNEALATGADTSAVGADGRQSNTVGTVPHRRGRTADRRESLTRGRSPTSGRIAPASTPPTSQGTSRYGQAHRNVCYIKLLITMAVIFATIFVLHVSKDSSRLHQTQTFADLMSGFGNQASRIGSRVYKVSSRMSLVAAGIWTTFRQDTVLMLEPASIGQELNGTYYYLSKTIATSNSLYKLPMLVNEQRRQALAFKIDTESPMFVPIGNFLNQSLDIDRGFVQLLNSTGQMGDQALLQQEYTTQLLLSIQGQSSLKPLKFRIEQHVQILSEQVTLVDQQHDTMLQKFTALTKIAEMICDAAIKDLDDAASDESWIIRAASDKSWIIGAASVIVRLPVWFRESGDMARIISNIQGAQEIHEWAKCVASNLEHTKLRLGHARHFLAYANYLLGYLEWQLDMSNLVSVPAVDWDRELMEFLAQMDDGVKAVKANTDKWHGLQQAGYI
ncbi:MAG: hypothetical protein Q9202_007251 [Teloschistes flavicans]